jgi:hypothetical protein
VNVSKKGNIDFTKGSIIRNLILFSVPITKAFGLTISTFVSQNVGARNYERSREGILRCLALSLAVTFVLGAVVLRQLFLAIVMRHPRIEYIYAAFPLGWGLTAFMLMIRSGDRSGRRSPPKNRRNERKDRKTKDDQRKQKETKEKSFRCETEALFLCYKARSKRGGSYDRGWLGGPDSPEAVRYEYEKALQFSLSELCPASFLKDKYIIRKICVENMDSC